MRLICPNCGAQYEVPDDVIPEAGRDVQCSNCGHTWFERPGASIDDEMTDGAGATGAEAAQAESEYYEDLPEEDAPAPADRPGMSWDAEDAEESEPEPTGDWPAAAPPPPEPEEVPQEAPDEILAPDPVDAPRDEPSPDTPPAAMPPAAEEDGRATRTRRRALDPEVASVLQEERAFSESARRRDSPPAFESQGDLALDDGTPEEEARRRRADRLHGATESDDPAQRRELLPDIEEINSSLRPRHDAAMADSAETREEAQERGRRRGFRVGFALMLFLAAALTLTYGHAARLAAAFPPAAPALTAYAESIDEGRLWLDLRLQEFLASMETEEE